MADERAGLLCGMIVRKDEAKRIVYGPVLVPGEPDSDDDVVTAEKIEQVAHKWLERYQNNDVQHTLLHVGDPVESYLTPVDLDFEVPGRGQVYLPKGTWMMGVKVADDGTWQQVVKGELTGFSIMAVAAAALKSAGRDQLQASMKRITLDDLGPDWEVVAVSLVDEPAVPKAKWVAVKNKAQDTVWERLVSALGLKAAAKAGRSISDTTLAQLVRARDAHKEALSVIEELIQIAESERGGKPSGKDGSSKQEGDDMNPDDVKAAVTEAVTAAIQPLTEALSQVATSLQGQGAPTNGEGGSPDDSGKAKGTGDAGGQAGKQQTDDPEKAALKTKVEELEAVIARSRNLKGQDGDEGAGGAMAAPSDRDAWGRKRRQPA